MPIVNEFNPNEINQSTSPDLPDSNVDETMKEEVVPENGADVGEEQETATESDQESIQEEETSEDASTESDSSEEEQEDEAEDEESGTDEVMDGIIQEFYAAMLSDEEIFDKMKTLPYLDLYAEQNALARQASDLFNIKQQIDSIKVMTDDITTAMVNMMDTLSQQSELTDEMQGLVSSVESFQKGYQPMMDYLLRSRHIVKRMLHVFDDDMTMSSAFINKSAIECAERRKARVQEPRQDSNGKIIPMLNKDMLVKRINTSIECYMDRTNMSALFSKMRNPNKTLETFKEFRKDGPEEAMKVINKTFMPVFNDMYMAKFRKRFADLLLMVENDGKQEGDEDFIKNTTQVVDVNIFFLTYWLAYVYERELDTGKNGQVRSLVMNVYDSDPSSNIYDLPGGIPYLARLCYVIYVIISNSISESYTSKQLNKAINKMVDDMLPLLSEEKNAAIFEEYPGKVIEHGTSLTEISDETITLDDIDEVDWDLSPEELWKKQHGIKDEPTPSENATESEVSDETEDESEEEKETADEEPVVMIPPTVVIDTDEDGCIEVDEVIDGTESEDDTEIHHEESDEKVTLVMDEATAAREQFYEETGTADITSSEYMVEGAPEMVHQEETYVPETTTTEEQHTEDVAPETEEVKKPRIVN